MKELLSNEEIDTLLEMFRADDATLHEVAEDSRPAASDTVVSRVDLLKPNRLGREQMRSLERHFQSASKALAASISEKLRLDVACDCVAVEQIRFQNWNALLSGPVGIYTIALKPLGSVLFTVTTQLLYGAVDRILGGSGRVANVPKDFTAAEYTVADAFVGPCMQRICDSLEDVAKSSWAIENRCSSPSMAQIMPGQEVVLSVHFQIGGEVLLGDLRLAIPYTALEPHLATVHSGPRSKAQQPGALRATIARTLEPVRMNLSVKLGDGTLPLRQLLSLAVGDVIPLHTRLGEPLIAPVQGVPKFAGDVGSIGNRLAFRVGAVLEANA